MIGVTGTAQWRKTHQRFRPDQPQGVPLPLLLVFISLALASIAEFASPGKTGRVQIPLPRIIAFGVMAILAIAVALRFGLKEETVALSSGLLVGAIGAATAAFTRPQSQLAPLGIGIACTSTIHLAAPTASLGLIFGAILSALALGAVASQTFAIVCTAAASADYLCAKHSTELAAPLLGSFVGLLVLVAGIAMLWLPAKLHWGRGVIGSLIVSGGVFVYTRSFPDKYLLISVAIGLACAVAIDWLLTDQDTDAIRVGLAAIIGIGVATVTFGLAQGAGMALALASSIVLLVALGNKDGILALGPLAGLVQFRLLSQMQPSSSHALDLGQHYALLCFTMGAVLPLIPLDWLNRQGVRAAAGSVLWAVLLFGIAPPGVCHVWR